MISFTKYHGAGNDFILIDDREKKFDEHDSELIREMCDRHFGIGADGLMLLRNHDDFDFEMLYFNSDGNTSSMCGNGGRCIVQFAHDLNLIDSDTVFIAIDGAHKASIVAESTVSLEMNDVTSIANDGEAMVLDTGSPHYVREVQDLQGIDLIQLARDVRYSDTYNQEGINVNLIQVEENKVKIRTYERGVEDETLACGTGVTAAALVAAERNNLKSPIRVEAVGGSLEVRFERNQDGGFRNIWKTGPTKRVFEGTYRR